MRDGKQFDGGETVADGQCGAPMPYGVDRVVGGVDLLNGNGENRLSLPVMIAVAAASARVVRK